MPATITSEATLSSVLHASLGGSPPRIVAAKGNYLRTEDGVDILDASGGAAVSCIGHGHPRVIQAIKDQLDAVEYCFSPWFTTTAYERLAKFLTDSTGGVMEKVFVCSSGAEAVEAALKMARQYFMELPEPQPQRTRFIARDRSYHGNTLGSLSVSGHKARRTIYEPMLSQNMTHVSPCFAYRGMKADETDEQYVARLAQELEDEFQRVGSDTVCGFVAETIAGLTLGGVPPVPGYLKAMKAVCDKHGALVILDEVFAGMGRTGTLHAWEQEGVVPHLQTIAKGLGAGYQAVGALLVSKQVVDVLSKGTKAFVHFQTYHGHPLACAAAYEVQQVIKDEGLIENCREMGAYLGELLKERLGSHKHVGDIRGRGLVWGIEIVKDRQTRQPFPVTDKIAPTIHATGLRKEFAISLIPGGGVADGTHGDLIVIAPAYNVTRMDVELIVGRAAKAIEHVLGGQRDAKL
ncbi:hypothetical protein LTR37_012773 [Vermiconidia calcicola]|uniref:Uncharacterized protein n=1 Tax=Vermiconidia calcicola TaxID=1690605 RepID=A0ACC3MYD7_9PEZI|nr:hypothetical protein LTR37_012773 [Vermiconidia calcicola]